MVVWLIHGTWARHSRWVRDGSALRAALQEAHREPVVFQSFQWTGRNRTNDRVEASGDLIDAVTSAGHPNEKRIAIAHSHGGNVAVLAASMNPGLFDRIITLNTPFLMPMPVNRTALMLHMLLLVASLSFIASLWLPVGYRIWGISYGISGILAILLGVWWLRDEIQSEMFIPLVRYAGTLDAGHPVRVLCLMSADDEAFGWLEALDVLSNLPRLMLSKTAVACTLLGIASVHWLFRWNFSTAALESFFNVVFHVSQNSDATTISDTVARMTPENIQLMSDRLYNLSFDGLLIFFTISVIAYFMTIWTVIAVGAIVATYTVRAVAFGEGIGLVALLRALTMRLKVTPTPILPAQTEVAVITSTTTRGLRHSDIYSNPNTLAEIVRWLKAKPEAV